MAGRRQTAATIRDVAARAGVSRMTVSRVVNWPDRVAPETRRRVEAAISDTGYLPNPVARQLASRAPPEGRAIRPERRIGLLYPDGLAATAGAYLTGLLESMGDAGFRLVPLAAAAMSTAPRLDGLLALHGAATLSHACDPGLPSVAIGPGDARPGMPTVAIDEKGSGAALARELMFLGHRRIAFLGNVRTSADDARRLAGLLETLEKFGVEADRKLILASVASERHAIAAAVATLVMQADEALPGAIIACGTEQAVACLMAASVRGLRVPEDLTICVFDDAAASSASWPELTRAVLPVAELCRHGFALLDEQLDGARRGAPRRVALLRPIARGAAERPAYARPLQLRRG